MLLSKTGRTLMMGCALALALIASIDAITTTALAASCPNEALREVQHSTFLPDCRAYELVSPPDKGGNDVLPDSARTRASADGGAASFSSLGAFGDALGTGVATDYIAVREPAPGTNGWLTHAITPPQRSLSFFAIAHGMDPLYEGEFSDDLSHGVFRAWSPLTEAPNVKNVENLYLRTDLLHSGAGSYQLLSNAVAPIGSETNFVADLILPRPAGASSDFKQLIFESRAALTPEASPGSPNLYEWDDGTLRLAGIRPDGSPAPSSLAGQGASNRSYTQHTISADGRRIFFTDPTNGFNGTDGELYMREADPETGVLSTVKLNVSERTDCADHDPCDGTPEPDPGGSQPATYWDASVDGGRVFFTSHEALTDDAPLNSDNKLYMYDTSEPASDPHNLTLVSVDSQPADSADVQGVMGASDDGHYVYFVAVGQLVAGEPDPSPNYGVYVWHDGSVSYVGSIFPTDVALNTSEDFEFDPSESRVTPDGTHLLFISTSSAGLGGYDQGSCRGFTGCQELYVYSATDKHVSCASCNPSGAPAAADATTHTRASVGGSSSTPTVSRAISDDGRRVFFTTAEALVPEDTNGKLDAYEYDVPSGKMYLLSTGKEPSNAYYMNSSTTGDDVFILTRQRLVGWDVDGAYDLYDVRVGGGVPEPTPAPPICESEACHGAASVVPAAPAFGATVVQPQGTNPPQTTHATTKVASHPVRCKRGFVRKRVRGKVRCVKRTRPGAGRKHSKGKTG